MPARGEVSGPAPTFNVLGHCGPRDDPLEFVIILDTHGGDFTSSELTEERRRLIEFDDRATRLGLRQSIIAATARYRLPAIYPFRVFTVNGGLLSYGVDVPDLFKRAASYVDRILRGAKATELPVQEPTKHELTINLKTAKALGLMVPPTLLARADEVVE
jgi:hypothetical protein